jgi:hypothetical protein
MPTMTIVKTSSGPKHATYKIGGIKLTALSDGYVDMPVSRLRWFGSERASLRHYLISWIQ